MSTHRTWHTGCFHIHAPRPLMFCLKPGDTSASLTQSPKNECCFAKQSVSLYTSHISFLSPHPQTWFDTCPQGFPFPIRDFLSLRCAWQVSSDTELMSSHSSLTICSGYWAWNIFGNALPVSHSVGLEITIINWGLTLCFAWIISLNLHATLWGG